MISVDILQFISNVNSTLGPNDTNQEFDCRAWALTTTKPRVHLVGAAAEAIFVCGKVSGVGMN